MDKEVELNLTFGAFKAVFIPIFSENSRGSPQPTLKTLKLFLDIIHFYGKFRLYIKLIDEDEIGTLTENGYQNGILGGIAKNEVDVGLFPIPLDTPEPPGEFTNVVDEDSYTITSFTENSVGLSQDIISSFLSVDVWVWILTGFLIIILEFSVAMLQCSSICKALAAISRQLPATLFNQNFSENFIARSHFRQLQIILVMMFTIIFGANFSTTVIVGNEEVRIDSLQDIVTHDKIPLFIESASMYEMFKQGATQSYLDVYRHAERKNSSQPIAISSSKFFTHAAPSTVILCSEKMCDAGRIIALVTNYNIAEKDQRSAQPYHRALLALIVNPREHKEETIKRINKIASRTFQAKISKKIFSSIIDEVLLQSTGISLFQRFSLNRKSWNPWTFTVLSLQGIERIFKFYIILMLIAVIILFIEIVGKYRYQ